MPLNVFFNKRATLAGLALFFGFVQLTFVLPFYSRVSEDKSLEISLQVSGVLLLFMLATLLAKPILTCIGPKTLCFFSLLMGAFGCLLIGNPLSLNLEAVPVDS